MKIIIALLFLMSTTLTFAGVGGEWVGWGEWTYEGSGTHCNMQLKFSENEKSFSRTNGYFDCGIVALDLDPVSYTKKGEELFDEENNLVGKLTSNSLELDEMYSETVSIKTVIKVDGRHFDYSEIWRDQKGQEIYNISGRLFLRD